MADERDRLRMLLGLEPLATETSVIDQAPIVDEQTQMATMSSLESAPTTDYRTAYFAAQAASKGEKPTPPPPDGQYKYDYVWRQDVGAPTGKWTLVRSPLYGSTGSISTSTGGSLTGTTSDSTLAAQQEAQAAAEEKRKAGQSAYTLLFEEFNRYGLGALIEPLKGFITEGLSPAEFTLRLRETDAYKKRFAANQQRIAKGLRALSEAQYIELEDQYQDVMRRYGLPESYYTRGEMGRQEGFEKFIAGDVSPVELEDRVQTAQRRVINAAPQIKDALMQYYGGEINNGDILAYVLDPDKAIEGIKRKVTAAEIGGAASRFGLGTARERAEQLGTYGVTSEMAQAGYEAIGGGLERGRQLSAIYGAPAYTQEVAETELFKLPSATEARKQRTQLIKKEQATFGGSTGVTGGALARDRAGQY